MKLTYGVHEHRVGLFVGYTSPPKRWHVVSTIGPRGGRMPMYKACRIEKQFVRTYKREHFAINYVQKVAIEAKKKEMGLGETRTKRRGRK